MIAWFALGLGVVVAAGLVWVEIRRRTTVTAWPEPDRVPYDQDTVRVVEERPTLTEEQKRDLQVVWAMVQCGFCGDVHSGMCPRVREVRYLPNGTFERVIFWHRDQWERPPGAITAWDVYGLAVPNVPENIGAVAEAAAQGVP